MGFRDAPRAISRQRVKLLRFRKKRLVRLIELYLYIETENWPKEPENLFLIPIMRNFSTLSPQKKLNFC